MEMNHLRIFHAETINSTLAHGLDLALDIMPADNHRHAAADQVEHYNDSKALSSILLVVSILSFFGAMSIILSSWLLQSFRYFRHRLILGLALSDACLTFNFIISTSLQASGHKIADKKYAAFCALNGFLTQMFVVQTDYWALVIAVCTFFLLGWGGRPASWIRRNALMIGAIPWSASMVLALLCLWIIGFGDVGGWCWLTHDRTHLFVNYIPRWSIIAIIICIYMSLFRFIHATSESADQYQEGSEFLQRARVREAERPRGDSESFAEGPVRHHANELSLRKASVRMMKYPVVYMIIWIIPTVVHLYHATSNGQDVTPDAITIIEKACVAGQGLIHALVYSCTERLWGRVFEKIHELGGVEELPWRRAVELTAVPNARRRHMPSAFVPGLERIRESLE